MFQITLRLFILCRVATVKGFYGYGVAGGYGYGGYGYGGYGAYGGYNDPSRFITVGAVNYGDPTKDDAFNNYQYYQPAQYGIPQQQARPNGNSASPAAPTTPAPTTPTPQEQSGCSSHNGCSGPSLCINGECRQMEPTQTRCTSDSDCPPGGGCKGLYCWQPPGTGGDEQPTPPAGGETQGTDAQPSDTKPGGPCKTQEECVATQMCGKNGKCVNGFSIEVECTNDGDCGKKNVCKGGTCWTEGDPGNGKDGDHCTEHTECSVKSVCIDKKCTPAIPSLDKCVLDFMCKGKGRVCKYFHCWQSMGLIGGLIG